jgi:hypothetical protein
VVRDKIPIGPEREKTGGRWSGFRVLGPGTSVLSVEPIFASRRRK